MSSVTVVKNPVQVLELLQSLQDADDPLIGYDYETWGDKSHLRPELCKVFKVLSIGVAARFDEIRGFSFPFDHPALDFGMEMKEEIYFAWRDLLRSKQGVAQNAKFEYKVNIKRFAMMGNLYDTMLMDRFIDENVSHKLGDMLNRHGLDGDYKKDMNMKDPLAHKLDDLLWYGGLDAVRMLELYESFVGMVGDDERYYRVLSMSEGFCKELALLEMSGMKVNRKKMLRIRGKMKQQGEEMLAELLAMSQIKKTVRKLPDKIKKFKIGDKFNPNSPTQVRILVKDVLKIKLTEQTASGEYKLDKMVLETYSDKYPIIAKLLKYRSESSMISGFVDKWDEFMCDRGYVHSSYNQEVVVTGRLSSTDPNLQNIPKYSEIRRIFESGYAGWLINADAAQQEPRLVAGISKELKMIEALSEGLNLHRFVASQIFSEDYDDVDGKQYDLGKRMNLGIIYGQTEWGLSKKTKLSIEEAYELLRLYDRMFPDLAGWREENHDFVLRHGWIEDIFGVRRHLPRALDGDEWERNRACRQAGNFVIQSPANTFNLISFCVASELFRQRAIFDTKVIGLVHDNLIVDTGEKSLDEAIDATKEAMLVHNNAHYWKDKGVPMMVDISIGRNLKNMKLMEN